MSGLIVTLRGIRYRPGRSLMVVLLASVAVAAGVLAPGYARAAQQSVLDDRLAQATPTRLGLNLQGTAQMIADSAGDGEPNLDQLPTLTAIADRELAAWPVLRHYLSAPLVGGSLPVILTSGVKAGTTGKLVYRPDSCAHLTVTSGRCPTGPGEILVSNRSAAEINVRVGDGVPIVADPMVYRQYGQQPYRQPIMWRIVGLYDPLHPSEPYWGTGAYFGYHPAIGDGASPGSVPANLDSMFVSSPGSLWAWSSAPYRLMVEYPLVPGPVRLDDIGPLLAGITAVRAGVGGAVQLDSDLPFAAADSQAADRAVARTIPLVGLPLLVLSWFVLFLAVAALSDERGAEIALGRLRGFRLGQVSRFSMAEPLVLIAAGAGPGFAAGYALTAFAADRFMAPGVPAELRWPLAAGALIAVAGGAVATVLASRRTIRTGVLALLRRVPPRSTWRGVAAEASVGVLAAAAVAQILLGGDRRGPLSYAAPPLIAVLAGLAAGRAVRALAAAQARRAGHRGRLRSLLAAVQVGRRPGPQRLIAVITVAVALLTFAATVWDVSRINRAVSAAATLGAATVYDVQAGSPRELMAKVAQVDPAGTEALAVTRTATRYNNALVQMVGIDASRFTRVGVWPDRSARQVSAMIGDLAPAAASTIELRPGTLQVDITATSLPDDRRVNLSFLVTDGISGNTSVVFGRIRPGRHTYTSPVTCVCRFHELVIGTFGGSGPFRAAFTVTGIRLDGRPMAGAVTDAAGWRPSRSLSNGQSINASGTGGLTVEASGDGQQDLYLERADTPAATPVVVAGAIPADGPAADFNFVMFGDVPLPLRVVGRLDRLPGAGSTGLVFDLRTEMLAAERDTGQLDSQELHYQVWANDSAGADLGARLTGAGLLVTKVDRIADQIAAMNRGAPALALRLYLFAGAIAVLLAIGAVLLTAWAGRRNRRSELAALRITGVPGRLLRSGLRREYAMVLGLPSLAGVIAGLASAALILPTIALVAVDSGIAPVYKIGVVWLPGALGLMAAGFLLVIVLVDRFIGGSPRRHGGVTNGPP